MSSIHSILKAHWGYASFRPLQQDIIEAVLDGRDCLALLPTGGGKSICFQVPAMAKSGLCLVVSPLIALMKDQVEALRKKNITAFAVHSGMTRREVIHTLKIAGSSNCKFLYVSPERLETAIFKEFLPSLDISLVAVDEAHCISQWGYDFRPSYRRIAALREELPGVPLLALTASATALVQQDICEQLLFNNPAIFRQSFHRPNLSYSVFNVSPRINKIVEIFNRVPGTGIVYCSSRKRTREIANILNINGISADHYHAGLPQEQRNEKQDAWLKNETRVIVCTNAFGMGIDKPDVRVVVHADIPDCLESYYQEAGRAGRDGKRSYAVLLYNESSAEALNLLPEARFPSLQDIRKVYGGLMNHLQIAAGTGEGNYYELDLSVFSSRFEYNPTLVKAALTTLEQEELMYFNEQVFLPAKLQVIAGRELLNELERSHPEGDALLKYLLRTYEGIVDQPVNIFEKMIASALRTRPEEVIAGLGFLHTRGIVSYIPQKEKPQLYLIQNRVPAADLHINAARYRKRKEQFAGRVRAMAEFLDNTAQCRSRMIGNYFGDEQIGDCGICDNCLNRRKKSLTATEFGDIYQKIREITAGGPRPVQELIDTLGARQHTRTWEAIQFLMSENKITVTDEGWISVQ